MTVERKRKRERERRYKKQLRKRETKPNSKKGDVAMSDLQSFFSLHNE